MTDSGQFMRQFFAGYGNQGPPRCQASPGYSRDPTCDSAPSQNGLAGVVIFGLLPRTELPPGTAQRGACWEVAGETRHRGNPTLPAPPESRLASRGENMDAAQVIDVSDA
jgi:hypothetical protein